MKKNKKASGTFQSPIEKKLYYISLFFIGLYLLFVPLFNLNQLIDPALFSKFTALSIGLLIAIPFFFYYRQKADLLIDLSIFKNFIFWAAGAYLLFSCLSIPGAVNHSEAVFDSLKNTVVIVFFLFSSLLLTNSKISIQDITKIVLIFTSVIVIIGIFQTLGVISQSALTKASAKEITAVFMNKNLFAQMLFLTLPFNVFGLLGLKRNWRVLSTINSTLVLVLIIVLYTRSVWLALIISSTITFVFVLFYNQKHKEKLLIFKKKNLFMIAGAVLVFTFLIILSSWGFDLQKGKTDKVFKTSEGRIAMWEKSVDMFIDYPLLGVGGGNWKIQIPKYGVYEQVKTRGKKRFQRAHNDYLSILTEYGIFALLTFLAILILGVYYLFKIIYLTTEKEEKTFYLLLLFGLFGYIVFSFFDYPKERIPHNIYLFFILSLVTAKYHHLLRNSKQKTTVKNTFLLALPVMMLLVVAVYFGSRKMIAENATKQAISALNANRPDATIEKVEQNYSWFYQMDPTATPLLWYKGLAHFKKGNNNEALKSFKGAAEINPYHSHTYNSIGIVYATAADFAQAKEFFLKSLALRPYSTETILNLVRIYNQDQEYNEAYKLLTLVNPKTNNDAYKISMVQVLDFKIDQSLSTITDSLIREYIVELKSSKPTTLAIYQSAVSNGHRFESAYLHVVATQILVEEQNLNQNQKSLLNDFLIKID